MVPAWFYARQNRGLSPTLGPYYGDQCGQSKVECECNEGARTLAVRSVASPATEAIYSSSASSPPAPKHLDFRAV